MTRHCQRQSRVRRLPFLGKRVTVLLASLGILLVVAGGFFISHLISQQTVQAASTPACNAHPVIPNTSSPDYAAPGVPAVPLHVGVRGPCNATFTVADVENYLATAPMPSKIGSSERPTVARITFMTVNEANVPLDGAIVERPGNAIVCYVVLHGNFTYGAPSTAPIIGTVQRSPAHHTAVLVFDAQSGNLLIAGVPAQEQ